MIRYEFLYENEDGVKIFARIDEDGKCRVTCTEDNPEYQAWLNPDKVEHLTEIIPADVANLHLAEAPAMIEATQPDEADLTEGTN